MKAIKYIALLCCLVITVPAASIEVDDVLHQISHDEAPKKRGKFATLIYNSALAAACGALFTYQTPTLTRWKTPDYRSSFADVIIITGLIYNATKASFDFLGIVCDVADAIENKIFGAKK